MAKVRIVVLLVSGIALILVLLALQLLAPGDKIDQTGVRDAHVVFSVDHAMLIAPGACVTVRWQVDHIAAVHFNDQPTIGQGIEQVCPSDSTLPTLLIEFQDHSSQEYHLSVMFLVEQPTTWLLGIAVLLLGLVSLYIALSRPSAAVPQPASGRRPRWVSLFAGIGIVFSVLVVVALLLELGLRFYFGHFGTSDEQIAYLLSRSQIDVLTSSTIPLPFVEYGLSADYPGHNSLGYRGDEIAVPKPSGVYRIVTLGDSSTYGALVPYDKTYSYDLQQVLRDDYGHKNIEVINGGVPGYNSWNFVADLAFRIPTLQPDLVIVYQGWLDVQARQVSPDCYSDPSPFLGLDPNRQLRAEPTELSSSALYRFLAVNFGVIDKPAASMPSSFTSSIGCSPEDLSKFAENLQANLPVYFERNIREEIAVAKENDFKIMFMTWAYNVNSPQLPLFRLPAIAEHNAITKQIALENRAILYDYAPSAPTDAADWADADHLSIQGNMRFAQNIARFMLDQGIITP